MFKLNKITNFLDSHPIGRIFNLGQKKVVWKKVTGLKTGMKIAVANSSGYSHERPEGVEWDEIVSIKKVGRERVYDIEVEGTHNFVGNGIIAHNTHISLTDTGDLNIIANSTSEESKPTSEEKFYSLQTATGEIIDRIGAFANIIAANIKAGAVIASQITTDEFTAFQGTIDHLLITSGLVAGNIQTKLISPLANESDVTIQLGNKSNTSSTSNTGKLSIQNADGTEVASVDSAGNATFSGTVNGEQLMVNGEATVSGTLFANNIHSLTIDQIQEQLRQVKTDQDLLSQAASWNVNTATDSAKLDQLAVLDLYVTNQGAFNSLSVANTMTIGSDLVIQSSLDPIYNILYTSLDTLTAPLKIQSLAMAPLEIMAGLVTIDTHGNMQIAGNLAIGGNLNVIGEITTQTGFKIQDSRFNDIASVNASGSAQFSNLSTLGLTIAGAQNATASAIVDGVITTNATAGSAVIPAGMSEITIKNPKVTDYTLVYVTPTSSTQNNVLYVKSKEVGKFTVGFSGALDADVNFNWWVIQVTQ